MLPELPDNLLLEHAYAAACRSGSDIHEHLPTLRALASECSHVTELGTRMADGSTVAFAAARVRELHCYDIVDCSSALKPLVDKAHWTKIVLHQGDVRLVELDETELLFIDTYHTYAQLSAELRLHASKARRWIALHDTHTFGDRGEDRGPGLWPAVQELLAGNEWEISYTTTANNGLTVLGRNR